MKIANFTHHEKPLDTGRWKKMLELASFDIEFEIGGAKLLWRGWSIRKFKKTPYFLQAPLIDKSSSTKDGPCIKVEGMPPESFLAMLRGKIKADHGIEVSDPSEWPKSPKKPPQNKPGAKVWRVAKPSPFRSDRHSTGQRTTPPERRERF